MFSNMFHHFFEQLIAAIAITAIHVLSKVTCYAAQLQLTEVFLGSKQTNGLRGPTKTVSVHLLNLRP